VLRALPFLPMPPGPLYATDKKERAANKKAWEKQAAAVGRHNQQLQQEHLAETIRLALELAVKLGATEKHLKELGFYDQHGAPTHMPNFDAGVHYDYEQLELR
jgi:hypothetical protein